MKGNNKINQKGITLVALVITIIVLLILASVSITGGLKSIKTSKETAILSELEMIQHAVLERYTNEVTMGTNNFPGQQKFTTTEEIKNEISELTSDTKLMNILENTKNEIDDFYYLEKEDLEELGITNADDSYIINYKIGLVIDVTNQLTQQGEAVYVYAKDGTE